MIECVTEKFQAEARVYSIESMLLGYVRPKCTILRKVARECSITVVRSCEDKRRIEDEMIVNKRYSILKIDWY